VERDRVARRVASAYHLNAVAGGPEWGSCNVACCVFPSARYLAWGNPTFLRRPGTQVFDLRVQLVWGNSEFAPFHTRHCPTTAVSAAYRTYQTLLDATTAPSTEYPVMQNSVLLLIYSGNYLQMLPDGLLSAAANSRR
jgi:hypothetical protein